jgi:hypothetical protein
MNMKRPNNIRNQAVPDVGLEGNHPISVDISGVFDAGKVSPEADPSGQNVPHDSQDFQDFQDSHDSQDSQGLSSTFKEKQRGVELQVEEQTIGDPSEENNEIPLPGNYDLASWVRCVYDSHKEQPGPEWNHWRSPLFYFTRLVKAHPTVTDMCDYKAAQVVEDILRRWLPPGKNTDPWEHFFPEANDGDDALADFMASWNKVRHVPFHDVLSNALRLGDEKPLKPPHPRGKLYQRFISLAGWLQMLLPGKPVLLPTRKLGELLECDQRTVSRMREFAEVDGLLLKVKAHSFRSGGKGKATEFRFAIERYPGLQGRQ